MSEATIPATSNPRVRLIALICLGGAAVLGSYLLTFSRPDAGPILWGGVPESWKGFYTTNMFVAAFGFFPFTLLFLRADPAQFAFAGGRGHPTLFWLYFLVLIPSALWLPLTYAFADSGGNMALWYLVRIDLVLVALGSIGLLIGALTIQPAPNRVLQVVAVVGAVAFCVQTALLDALLWPHWYPLP